MSHHVIPTRLDGVVTGYRVVHAASGATAFNFSNRSVTRFLENAPDSEHLARRWAHQLCASLNNGTV